MIAIQYIQSNQASSSPQGQPSFPVAEFPRRMAAWRPNWESRVHRSSQTIGHQSLPLAGLVYDRGSPDAKEFSNGDTVLLFEKTDCYCLVRADFFTRLLFTEQRFIQRTIKVGSIGETTMAIALAERRDPSDPFWRAVGFPGIPLAIGVNMSLRTEDSSFELLAHKQKKSQGEMGGTVGPPVSAGANPDLSKLDFDTLTLAALVDSAMHEASRRELGGLDQPTFFRRAAWLDSGRGHKPEVNYRGKIDVGEIGTYTEALCKAHLGCIQVRGHLTPAGELSDSASKALKDWGLNFQTWCLWL